MGSNAASVGGKGLLAVCQLLGVMGHLGHALVQLRNSLSFKLPSLITLSISDSADLKQEQASLPSMQGCRRETPTSASRLRTSMALQVPEKVLM